MSEEFTYRVPVSFKVRINKLELGAGLPVRVQSMANTDTNDITGSLAQSLRIIEAGGQLVRFTTQGKIEVENLGEIIRKLREAKNETPIVADVHFRAEVAELAAIVCDKVRINPGNFVEKAGSSYEFSNEDYQEGYKENRSRLLSFLDNCKKHQTAVRIGVNHGSLSKRIMSKYGDTPEGMAESTLEYLRVCKEASFKDVVVSLKSSNTRLMVHAVRLLARHMLREDLYYPIHLGVTESGDGLEGRIKSVVGIAALLQEGFGDTIRVSLTEAPENEIPVARKIVELFTKPEKLPYNPLQYLPWDPCQYSRPNSKCIHGVGGDNVPVVLSPEGEYPEFEPDFNIVHGSSNLGLDEELFVVLDNSSEPEILAGLKEDRILFLDAMNMKAVEIKQWLVQYYTEHGLNPVIISKEYAEINKEAYILHAAGEFGLLLIDGLISGVSITNPAFSNEFNNWLSFYILQASRERTIVTDYIACPSCGRTLFNIQHVLQDVKKATSHLKGLKIAVMGCIVNGPGEMADADYGYIGAGTGKVSIYKGKDPVQKHVPEKLAIEKLIEVIKVNGDWKEPGS